MSGINDAPRVSTSKDNTTYPMATTQPTDNDSSTARYAELRQDLADPGDIPSSDGTTFAGSPASLAKLQTYLPTGTWLAYTALKTWAFSIRPGDPPASSLGSCTSHQRIALIIVTALCAALSFLSSFVKSFLYDTTQSHVLFPVADYFRVASKVTDPVTGVQFPCRTPAGRFCWPLVDAEGELVYDETCTRLRVAVFRANIPVLPFDRNAGYWRAFFGLDIQKGFPPAPYLYPPPPAPHQPSSLLSRPSLPSIVSHSAPLLPPAPAPISSPAPAPISSPATAPTSSPAPSAPATLPSVPIPIDAIARPPDLIPRWSLTFGAQGSSSYIDLHLGVWGHAIVSLLAFFTLALWSNDVVGCLYPRLPDYLLPPLQTGILAILSTVAAVVIQDHSVGLGQGTVRISSGGGERREIPEYLESVVEMVVWVARQ